VRCCWTSVRQSCSDAGHCLDGEAVADNEATNRKSAIAAVVLGVVAIVISLGALVFRIWLIV